MAEEKKTVRDILENLPLQGINGTKLLPYHEKQCKYCGKNIWFTKKWVLNENSRMSFTLLKAVDPLTQAMVIQDEKQGSVMRLHKNKIYDPNMTRLIRKFTSHIYYIQTIAHLKDRDALHTIDKFILDDDEIIGLLSGKGVLYGLGKKYLYSFGIKLYRIALNEKVSDELELKLIAGMPLGKVIEKQRIGTFS